MINIISIINDNYKEFYQKIFDKLDDYSYREKRYNFDFSIVIASCEAGVDSTKLNNLKRQTDELVFLQDNLFCIVLDGANDETGIKVATNIKNEFLNIYSDTKLFIGVVTSRDYISLNDMIDSLFKTVEYSIVNNIHNIVIDKNRTFYN